MKTLFSRMLLIALTLNTALNVSAMEPAKKSPNTDANQEIIEQPAAATAQNTVVALPPAMPAPIISRVTNAQLIRNFLASLASAKHASDELMLLREPIPTEATNRLMQLTKTIAAYEQNRIKEQEELMRAQNLKRQQEENALRLQQELARRLQWLKEWVDSQIVDVVTLKSQDEHEFTTPMHRATLSKTIKNLIEDAGTDHPIPLPNISSATLRTLLDLLPVMEFAVVTSMHEPDFFIPGYLQPKINKALSAQLDKLLSAKSAEQMSAQREQISAQYLEQIIDLFVAANYLDIPYLTNGFAAAIADRIPAERYKLALASRDMKIHNPEERASYCYILKEQGLGAINRITNDTWCYIAKHLTHRLSGITQEYSVADFLLKHPKARDLKGNLALSYGTKITSLFGLQLLKNKNEITGLDLSNNCFYSLTRSLDPQMPEHPFAGFDQLTCLTLNGCHLSSIQADIFAGCKAPELSLCKNSLATLPVNAFRGMDRLLRLNLENNELCAIPVGAFAELPNLYKLQLSRNKLSTLPVNVFNGLESLEDLQIEQNQLKTMPTGAFAGLRNLRYLDLRQNQLTQLNNGLCSDLCSLQRLVVNQNRLTTIGANALIGADALQTLELYKNKLRSLPRGLFAGNPNLKVIELRHNNLKSMPTTDLNSLTKLEKVYLAQNKFDPETRAEIRESVSEAIRIPGWNGATLKKRAEKKRARQEEAAEQDEQEDDEEGEDDE